MIRLAAFDVDGTLRDREYLPESTKSSLRRLQEQGVVLALCTGRSEYEIAALREELGIDWAITCNGSHIGFQGKTHYGNAFEQSTVQRWLQEANRKQHALLLYGADQMYSNLPDHALFRQAQQEIGFLEPVGLEKLQESAPIYQCIVFCSEEEEAAYTGTEREHYYIHRWRPWAVDFNPNGMNKALGLRRLLEHLEIHPSETAAFGDGLNDLEMLEFVGYGVAMGNAGPELKSRARYITRTLDEHGIAHAVDQWFTTSPIK
jgi:Cof subfamily protein (haloacid dehalogenase superfamily)